MIRSKEQCVWHTARTVTERDVKIVICAGVANVVRTCAQMKTKTTHIIRVVIAHTGVWFLMFKQAKLFKCEECGKRTMHPDTGDNEKHIFKQIATIEINK